MGLILFEIYYPPAQRSLDHTLTQLKNLKTLPREFRAWPEVSRNILSLLEYDPKKRPTIASLVGPSEWDDVAELQKCCKALNLGQKQEIHKNTACDGCRTSLITGIRYRCKSCDNFNYCSDCYRSAVSHRSKHDFISISMLRLDPVPDERYDRDIVHHDIRCDGCREMPIQGRRYMCQTCNNFDLCRKCYVSQAAHREKHDFSLVTKCELHRHVCKDV